MPSLKRAHKPRSPSPKLHRASSSKHCRAPSPELHRASSFEHCRAPNPELHRASSFKYYQTLSSELHTSSMRPYAKSLGSTDQELFALNSVDIVAIADTVKILSEAYRHPLRASIHTPELRYRCRCMKELPTTLRITAKQCSFVYVLLARLHALHCVDV